MKKLIALFALIPLLAACTIEVNDDRRCYEFHETVYYHYWSTTDSFTEYNDFYWERCRIYDSDARMIARENTYQETYYTYINGRRYEVTEIHNTTYIRLHY